MIGSVAGITEAAGKGGCRARHVELGVGVCVLPRGLGAAVGVVV